MYRFGATTIDAYLLYRDTDWFTYDKFYKQISGKDEFSRAAQIGVAFQNIVEQIMINGIDWIINYREHLGVDSVEFFKDGDFAFDTECFARIFSVLPISAIPELKSKLTYQTNYGKVDVICKTDAAMGLVGYDTKTSLKAMQFANYTDKYQWRFYSVCFGFEDFVWPLVQLKEDRKNDNHFSLHSIKTAHQSRYPGIEKDCEDIVNEFVGFCDDQGWLEHILPYWEKK